MDENKEMIMPFERLSKRTIQKDDDLNKTLFSDVYQQAARIVETIIHSNDRYRSETDTSSINRIRSQYTTDINNVIAFTGRRGTGKTSAMLAFAEALANNNFVNDTGSILSDTQFTVLPYVDASMAGIGNEDFFEIIIFKMLKYLEDYANINVCNDSEELRKLEEKLASIYNHYSGLGRSEDTQFLPSYSVMKKRMEKHDIRSEIIELVHNYNIFINTHNRSGNGIRYKHNNLLVICIDDIDMARKGHIDIMQIIYQYFMIPGVIVMATMNFGPLLASVKKEFYSYFSIEENNNEFTANLQLSQEQSLDYMRKIIPSDMRITMPSWKKTDLRDSYPIVISIDKSEDITQKFPGLPSKYFQKLIHAASAGKNNTVKISPKKLLMILLAERAESYLDTEGHKIHFMEPDSLRGLYDMFYLLYYMKPISNVPEEERSVNLRYNRKILLNFLYFKLIPDLGMDSKDTEMIKKIESDTIDRRGKEIWEYYYRCLIEPENNNRIQMLYGSNFLEREKGIHNQQKYNFGEVFRVLYSGTRLKLFDKKFVKSILAIYSFVLPQYIESVMDQCKSFIVESENLFDRLYSFKDISNVFGYSLIGEWYNDLFNGSTVSLVINKIILINYLKTNARIEEFVRHFIYLLLLSRRSSSKEFNVADDDWRFSIDVEIDPTSFIVGMLRIERLKNMRFRFNDETYTLCELIYRMYLNAANEQVGGKKQNALFSRIKDAVKKTVQDIYNSAAAVHGDNINTFLLKNTDLTYNAVKRAVKYFLYPSDGNLDTTTEKSKKNRNNQSPFCIIQKFYKILNAELKNITSVYNLENNINLEDNIVVDWFISSKSYGKYCCIADATEGKVTSSDFFYKYGCGLEYENERVEIEASMTFERFIRYWFNDINIVSEYTRNNFYWIYQYLKYSFRNKLNANLPPEMVIELSKVVNKYIGSIYNFNMDYSLEQFDADIIHIINEYSNYYGIPKSKDILFNALDDDDRKRLEPLLPDIPEKIPNLYINSIINDMGRDIPIEKLKEQLDSILETKAEDDKTKSVRQGEPKKNGKKAGSTKK